VGFAWLRLRRGLAAGHAVGTGSWNGWVRLEWMGAAGMDGCGWIWMGAAMARAKDRVSRVTVMPQNAGALLASGPRMV
jgi:hypothetical protein